MINRRALLALTGGLAVGLMPKISAAAENAGTIATLTGKANARGAGATADRVLNQGDAVQVGDVLETLPDSRLSLRLGPSTVVNLGPATKLRVEKHSEAGSEFELVDGSIYYEHARKPNEAPQKTLVRSPFALLTVKGTKFFAGPTRGEFGCFVAEGRVDVTAAGETVAVHPGFGSGVRRKGGKPSRAAKWAPARIGEALFLAIARRSP